MMNLVREFEMLSKYYESVKEYAKLPKDAGFDVMERILAEMEDDGMSFSEAYDAFGEMVDYVTICERK
jgi:hypothetical protein